MSLSMSASDAASEIFASDVFQTAPPVLEGAFADFHGECFVLLFMKQVLPQVAHRLSDVLSIAFPYSEPLHRCME